MVGWIIGGVAVGVAAVAGTGYYLKKKKAAAYEASRGTFLRPGRGWSKFGSETYQISVQQAQEQREAGRKGPIPIATPGGIYVQNVG